MSHLPGPGMGKAVALERLAFVCRAGMEPGSATSSWDDWGQVVESLRL